MTGTLNCLGKNPKSYGAWHHRAWCLQRMASPDWDKEISLCDMCLKQDERNFHCWDHRVFVVKARGGGLESELEFADSKVMANQSNYSAWHYRSTLLPKVRPAKEDDRDGRGIGISMKQWEAELDLVLSSLYTGERVI